MKQLTAAAALGISLVFGISSAAQAQALTPIKISYQPSLYWALPFHIATEKGWWKDVGLVPEFSTFPAGVPQIAASAAGSWDVGGTGLDMFVLVSKLSVSPMTNLLPMVW